jgi:hypothetical protein
MGVLLTSKWRIELDDPLRFEVMSEPTERGEATPPTAVAVFGIVELVIAQDSGRVESVRWHHDAVDPQPSRLPAIRPRGGGLMVSSATVPVTDGVIAGIDATLTYRDDRTMRTMIVRRGMERVVVDRYVRFADRTAAGLRGGSLVALWWNGADERSAA